ncbi:MAG: tRNA (adenosine(37)-N6)-threonylcarbamoyltransferase complex dimerization subunit type 1 TsaB [Paracoccaceae bacterium]
MTVLAFDTSGPWVAACLWQDGAAMDTRVEEMSRGQAERLMPLLEEILDAHSISWADLTTIGVGIGPGNFTGIRIAVSAARGLGMGLNIPVVGANGFDSRALCHPAGTLVAISAPRDQVYVADPDPRLVPALEVPEAVANTLPSDLVEAIAQHAQTHRHDPNLPAPAPLYVRPADAAPSRDAPPVMLD